MGLHLNPIEPDDWANGPDYAEPDCPDCDGTGMIDGDDELEHTCPKCDGSGYLPDQRFDDDVI